MLGQDNAARKDAEEHLKKIRDGEPDKYGVYLTSVMMDQGCGADIKSLAAVILRRSICSAVHEKTLWESLTPDAREFMKSNLLVFVRSIQTKDLIHKTSNLLVEVAGAMHSYENEAIWQDLLNLVFEFVNSDNNLYVDSALQIFNGLFSYIIDHLNKYKTDLIGIFRKTLTHTSLDIRLASL